MREIKFRMWDTLTNKYFTDQDEVMECLKQQVSGFHNHEANGSVFEQYTGLKDKNGVEIYEGDVVRRLIGTSFVVSFVVEIPQIFFPTQSRGELEVVGNVHDKQNRKCKPKLTQRGKK